MKDRTLSMSRGHLLALGAMSLASAVLAFFVGVAVGRRAEAPVAGVPAVAPLVADDVRSGSLERLLARVSEEQAPDVTFPAALSAVTPSASLDGIPTGGWSIQVGEFPDATAADRLVGQLREGGLPAYRVRALVDGRSVHRVRVSGYGTRDAASSDASSVASRAGAESGVVVPAP
jgi:cell division septation protein DedD